MGAIFLDLNVLNEICPVVEDCFEGEEPTADVPLNVTEAMHAMAGTTLLIKYDDIADMVKKEMHQWCKPFQWEKMDVLENIMKVNTMAVDSYNSYIGRGNDWS